MSTVIKVMAISIILLIIIFSALIAYKGIPYLNKKHNKY